MYNIMIMGTRRVCLTVFYYLHNIRDLVKLQFRVNCCNEEGELQRYMLMTLDSFWTLFSSKSPFLMVSWYCQFLLSGLQRSQGP